MMIEFEVPGEPKSKARARVVHGEGGARSFTPVGTREAQQRIALLFRQARGPGRPLADVGFGVEVTFYRANRQRRDVDNMSKLVLDALTGLAWVDDSQVTDLIARVRYDGPARSAVRVFTTDERPPQDTFDCQRCGVATPTYSSWRDTRSYCSSRCRDAVRADRRDENRPECEVCGARFARGRNPRSANRFCSMACRSTGQTVEITCETCGKVERLPSSIAARRRNCSKACRTRQQVGRPRGAPRTTARATS